MFCLHEFNKIFLVVRIKIRRELNC